MSDDLIIKKEAEILPKFLRRRTRKKSSQRTEEEKKESLSKSKTAKSTKQKADRRRWLMEGLCTRCGKGPPMENRRLCDVCSDKSLKYNEDHRYRRKIKEADDDRS